MIAYQRLVNNDNIEVLLFPLDVMYITQGENGSISHSLAMDFVGYSSNGQISTYPFYAPCTLVCVDKNYNNGQAYIVYESKNKVLLANGDIDYITIVVMHDNSPIYNIGDVVLQGELLGHTGTAGYVTGDHTHFNVAKGKYQGWQSLGNGFSELVNSIHLYDAFYINDTVIYNDNGYAWKKYDGGVLPPTPPPVYKKEAKKFKWVVYTRLYKSRKIAYFNNKLKRK